MCSQSIHHAIPTLRRPTTHRQPSLLPGLLLVWQQLLACLSDVEPPVRAAAASLLGAVGGALARGILPAAQPPPSARDAPAGRGGRGLGGRFAGRGPAQAPAAPPPPPPTLLFDWLLPLLGGQTDLPGAGRPATPDVQAALCQALAEAVSHLPHEPPSSPTPPPEHPPPAAPAARAAVAPTLVAIHKLLESEATPPGLLGPLLRLLLCCARCAPGAVGGLWEDLVDLLLGWSLEPTLSDADR
jgi:hypothetical protein